MNFRRTLMVVMATAALAVACGGATGGGGDATSTGGSGTTATPKSAFGTPAPTATAAGATAAPKSSATAAPTPLPTNIESKGFVSTCNPGGPRWYGAYAKVPDGAYVSGGALEVLLQTANGTELQRVPVNLQQALQGPTQGYLVSKAWTTAQIGGELSQVKVGVTQQPTPAQLPDLAKANPFELKVTDVVFTTTGPQLAITTENKGEVNVSYRAEGFLVTASGELVGAFQGQGTAVAKAPATVSRLTGSFSCPNVAAPVTAYVQVVVTQQAGSQNGQRTEIQAFTKGQ